MKTFTFAKPEHLCLRRDIDELFTAGSSAMTVFPLRTIFRSKVYGGNGPRVKVLISVSKRRFHHAVDRNRAKRQVREAYRQNKQLLLSSLPDGAELHVGFVWLSEKPLPTKFIASRMVLTLQRMAEKMAKPDQATDSQQEPS